MRSKIHSLDTSLTLFNPIENNLTLVRVLLGSAADANTKNETTYMSFLIDTELLHQIQIMLAEGPDIIVLDQQEGEPLYLTAIVHRL